jgi:hypothetical protein
VRPPVLGAGRRVDRENIEFGRADERPLHHEQTGLEARELAGVVSAEHLQLPDVLGVDLAEVGEALGGKRFVVAWPVRGGRRARSRRRGGYSALVIWVRFHRDGTRTRKERQDFAAQLADAHLDSGLVRKRGGDSSAHHARV